MLTDRLPHSASPRDIEEASGVVAYDFGLKRRAFVQILGAGLLLAVGAPALAQRRGGRGSGGPRNIAARIHLGKDGSITVMTGKVEGGQGARAELSQAAAEELRVTPSRIQLVMGDTSLVPDDGITAGSGSTPRTVPSIRQGAAAARDLLVELACRTWTVDRSSVRLNDGKVSDASSQRSLTYADLAASQDASKALPQSIPSEVALTSVKEWKILGQSTARPNGRDLVTGTHQYPSDIIRPDMLYGKILRAPSYGAKLVSVDLGPAKAMKDVLAVQDGQFVGVAAPTAFLAEQARSAIAGSAKW